MASGWWQHAPFTKGSLRGGADLTGLGKAHEHEWTGLMANPPRVLPWHSLTNRGVGEDSPPVKHQSGQWSGHPGWHWALVPAGSSGPFVWCGSQGSQARATHWLLYQPENSKTRERRASVSFALSSPPEIQGSPLRVDFVTSNRHICCRPLPFFLFQQPPHVWRDPFTKVLSARHRTCLWVFLWTCLRGNWFVGSVCPWSFFGFAPYFKMGFNRDDCLTMGDNVKYLWVANCFLLN